MSDQAKSLETTSQARRPAVRTPDLPLTREDNRSLEPQKRNEHPLYSPHADILETKDEFMVIADLPGVDENKVEVNLEKNILTINAFPAMEQPQGYRLFYSEYAPGEYERRFVLSDVVDRDKIEARVKNGVLYLRLPKATQAKARQISVRSG